MLPSASGAAIERAERISAAFQGAIAPTTPTGRRMPIANAPVSDGMTCPSGAYASAAACRNRFGTKNDWNMPNPKVDPVSRASIDTTSSRRSSSRSAAFRKMRCRSAGGVARQAANAADAASIAARRIRGPGGGNVRDDVARERVAVLVRGAARCGRPFAADELLVLVRGDHLLPFPLVTLHTGGRPAAWRGPCRSRSRRTCGNVSGMPGSYAGRRLLVKTLFQILEH